MNSINIFLVFGWVNVLFVVVLVNIGWGDSNNKVLSGLGVWGDLISFIVVSIVVVVKSGYVWSGVVN